MMIRGQFSDFFDTTALPALRAISRDRLKHKPMKYRKIFHVMTSDRSIEQFSGVSGMGLAAEIAEGEDIRYDSIVQEFDSLFRHKKFGLAARFSKELFDDDRKGVIKQRQTALTDALNETIEIQAASVLNTCTTANPNGFISPDGVALVSLSHPLVKAGGVQANRPTVGAALTHDSLAIELTSWELTKKSNGHDAMLPTPNLIVHPANRWNSAEILKSTGRSDTTNNTTNVLRNSAENGGAAIGQTIAWSKLTDTAGWFLIEPPSETSALVWMWRMKPYLKGWYDDSSEISSTAYRYRESHGYRWWEGLRFSSPSL